MQDGSSPEPRSAREMTVSSTNFARIYRQAARDHATFPAVIGESTVLSHGQLLAAGCAVARRMQAIGIDRSSIVAFNSGDLIVSLTMLIGTALVGCRLVTASDILARQDIIHPTHFLRTYDAAGKRTVPFQIIGSDWFEDAPQDPFSAVDDFPGHAAESEPWLVLHTSGTTGRPKFFTLSPRQVADRTRAIAEDFPTASITCAMLFNPTSRPFFARAIGALTNACTLVDSLDPDFWVTAGMDTLFCSPGQFRTFYDEAPFTARFSKVEVSGARLEDEDARLLAGRFDTVIDIYGASETNKSFANIVTVDPDGRVRRRGKRLDSEVEIRDPEGRPTLPGQLGTVRVRNPYLAEGYLEAPEATAKSFVDGWFVPGDVARWGTDGHLDVLGRVDEVISFGGVKIDGNLIDMIIKTVDGVRDAVCVRSPKTDRREIVGFIVFEDGVNKPAVVAAVREAYEAHTGLPCFLGPLHELKEVPYDEDGRPLRYLCEQMLAARIADRKAAVADLK